MKPSELWEKYSTRLGIDKQRFDDNSESLIEKDYTKIYNRVIKKNKTNSEKKQLIITFLLIFFVIGMILSIIIFQSWLNDSKKVKVERLNKNEKQKLMFS